jgi:hypothetical protein
MPWARSICSREVKAGGRVERVFGAAGFGIGIGIDPVFEAVGGHGGLVGGQAPEQKQFFQAGAEGRCGDFVDGDPPLLAGEGDVQAIAAR